MSGEPLETGQTLELKCATQQIPCKVKKIANRMNSSSLEIMAEESTELEDTEVAKLLAAMHGALGLVTPSLVTVARSVEDGYGFLSKSKKMRRLC